ncbi:KH domain-containing protein At4g18375 [Impatiens glandulifera]|uniref:KH domain-containing protein At4g18375 n=1 Tax=Impatiens glandulifera TaxID=253017 RepID=UPI001FB14994|nr:KH domain-containing protein At4g18375 [Impatiens glandulifera]
MGETGKRGRSHRDSDRDKKDQKRRATDRDDRNEGELVVYRIICPDGVIGSVIGKSGKVINSIRQDTRAKIKVVDPFPGSKNRVILIYYHVREKQDVDVEGEFNDMEPLCPAQDALLKVQEAIAGAINASNDNNNNIDNKKYRDKEECQILVPASQTSSIIGKSGSIIKRLRNITKAAIKVIPRDASDPSHSCALDFDNFVVISGEPESVKRALFAVSSIIYKFQPKEAIPLDTNVPEPPPTIIIPSDFPIYAHNGIYTSVESLLPSRSVPSVISSATLPELPRYSDERGTWPSTYSSALPVGAGYGGSSRSEEFVVRILCPRSVIGRVIGKGGSSIKGIRQASGARIDVDDAKHERDECIITITSTESSDDVISKAVEAVLMLQEKMADEDVGTLTIRLLVPTKVIDCLLGRGSYVINEIRKRSKAEIRISRVMKPKYTDMDDELIEVMGEVDKVRDALLAIVMRLRDDVLNDRERYFSNSYGGSSVYSAGTSLTVPSALPSAVPMNPYAYEPRSEPRRRMDPLSSSGGLYGYGSLPMGDNDYGSSLSSYSSKIYGGLPPPSTLEILIPAHAVGKVMGKGGANIANLRKISGAAIEITDVRSSRGDRLALISGTADEKRAAENLIQAFIMST